MGKRALRTIAIALAALLAQSFFFLLIPVLNALFFETPKRGRAEIAEAVAVETEIARPKPRQNQREIKPIRSQFRLKSPRAAAGTSIAIFRKYPAGSTALENGTRLICSRGTGG